MARDVADQIIEAQGRLHEASSWIWLYELEVPTSPATRYRLTSYSERVEFGVNSAGEPLVYYPASVSHGAIQQTKEGDIPTIAVTVGNVDTEVGKVIDTHDGMRGSQVRIMLVRADTLGDPNAKIEWKMKVARVGIYEETATFELRPISIGSVVFPRWRYLSQSCRFSFGDNLCGYIIPTGADDTDANGYITCNKTVEKCTLVGDSEVTHGLERKHPLRFGGHPGITRS